MEIFKNLENWRKQQHLREVLLMHFFSKKTAAESHRLLIETYGEYALPEKECLEWFRRFECRNFDISEELETVQNQDPRQKENLSVSQQAKSKRLKNQNEKDTDQ